MQLLDLMTRRSITALVFRLQVECRLIFNFYARARMGVLRERIFE
jgi:hypothetical protein